MKHALRILLALGLVLAPAVASAQLDPVILEAESGALGSQFATASDGATNWWQDTVTPGDPAKNRARIADAVGVAAQADAVVVVVGTNESTSREAWADNHLGDAADLSLSAQQDELVDALLVTKKPLVMVLVNGRPLAMPDLAARVPAILESWYLGQEGGTAIGEALFGDVNPGGKLPVSIPRTSDNCPSTTTGGPRRIVATSMNHASRCGPSAMD